MSNAATIFEKPRLFCVAAEVRMPDGTLISDLYYCHATCAAIARTSYIAGLPHNPNIRVRIVDAAVVIGYFGDEKGENITV